MSVHASPSEVIDESLSEWPEQLVQPAPRPGLRLWDSDMLLASVAAVAVQGRTLVAGDWNEAREWDLTHVGGSGAAFFKQLGEVGLVDCTWTHWNETERATCHPQQGASLQVDRIFATVEVATNVHDCAVEALPSPDFDHMPISFLVGTALS